MDIYCVKCGEPWDIDELHDAEDPDTGKLLGFHKALKVFRGSGCEVFGSSHNSPNTNPDKVFGLTAAEASAVLFDILGDDVDGIAAEMSDMFG